MKRDLLSREVSELQHKLSMRSQETAIVKSEVERAEKRMSSLEAEMTSKAEGQETRRA